MTKILNFEKKLNLSVNQKSSKFQTKSSYPSKYGKIKINFFKISLWMKYFEHKEAAEQDSPISIKIRQNYGSLKKCGRRHQQNLDCYVLLSVTFVAGETKMT